MHSKQVTTNLITPVSSKIAVPGACDWQYHCHAIRYRLSIPPPLNELQQTFSSLITELTLQSGGDRFSAAKFWVDEIPNDAESIMAARRRSIEMKRPVDALSGWRVLLLRYRCRAADLILVARHALMDLVSLEWIAQTIIAGADQPLVKVYGLEDRPPHASTHGFMLPAPFSLSPVHPQLAWCLNSGVPGMQQGVVQVNIGNGMAMDSAILIAATGLMAARYSGIETVVVATTNQRPELEPYIIGALERLVPMSMSCNEDLQTGKIVASITKALADPASSPSLELRDRSVQVAESEGGIAIGAFLAPVSTNTLGMEKLEEYWPIQSAIYPITMVLRSDSQRNVTLHCNYMGIGFDEVILAQFTRSVARAYVKLLMQGDLHVTELEPLSVSEQVEVARIGRSIDANPSCHDTVPGAFKKIASQLASKPAIGLDQIQLSYRQLDECANRVTRVLASYGIGTGQCVGVCVDRSCELIIILLAVMKAGATYVPMEPDYPSDRLAFITRDSGITLIVTSKTNFPISDRLQVLNLARLMELSVAESSDPIDLASSPESIAYIIYTSGSTGRPKGVAVPHQNVLSLIAATRENFELSCRDIWTFFHSSAFDFSVWEIWGCLLTGGRLVVVPYWISRSPSDFLNLLKAEGVTVLNQTPSAFAQLIDADRVSSADLALRLVIFGGEPLNPRMLIPWFDRHSESQCRLVNMFGITETTVHVTAESISRNHALKSSRSVGRPLPGWHLYIMDSAGRLAPPGVAGEISVGGAGVALYYVNQAALTAERFVPDPHGSGRIYRSGDKGRLLPDGSLEHLGRLDNQVKVRGFRIELNEIQAVLLDAPQVLAAVVVFHQDDPIDAASARLDAYVVMEGGKVDEVRRHISRLLPEYMMPAYIVVLPALPLTGNGKLDVNRLPNPREMQVAFSKTEDNEVQEDDREYEFTDRLLQIWRGVLKVPIGLDDNFFDLGGNSLYAVRIASAVREEGLPSLPVRDIYMQTIRRIAKNLRLRAEQSTVRSGNDF
jgi:amino acid adenylation domain-containing protein